MAPTINEGDLIIYLPYKHKRTNNNLQPGQILVSKHPLIKNKLIIKRLFKKDINGVQLLGDNELRSQDSRHFGLVNYDNLVGIVERIIPLNA